jgi:hypothetical protein
MRQRGGSLGRGLAVGLLLGFALALAAGTQAAHAADSAFVRVIHGIANKGAVDVYLDNGKSPLLSNLAFGKVSDYTPVAAGNHTVQVTDAGKPVGSAFLHESVSLTAGGNYTLAAVGDSSTAPSLAVFQDDNTVASGQGKLRVYQLSTDVGAAALDASGHAFTPSSINFKGATDYNVLQPGAYSCNLKVLKNGTVVPQAVTLQKNQVTSVFVVGKLSPGKGESKAQAVVASVAGVPTGLPPTGFAPGAPDGEPLAALVYLGLALLAVTLVARSRAARRAWSFVESRARGR